MATPAYTLVIGDRMPDGTKYAGVSPTTNKPFYALPADVSLAAAWQQPAKQYRLVMTWKEAVETAGNYAAHTYPAGTFRLPTMRELSSLYNHRAAIGDFCSDISEPLNQQVAVLMGQKQQVHSVLSYPNVYWSSSVGAHGKIACKPFIGSYIVSYPQDNYFSVRLVKD